MRRVFGIILWALACMLLGMVSGGTLGGVIVWIQIQSRPTGWDGIFVAAGVLTAGLIGGAIGIVVGTGYGIIRDRRGRKMGTRR